jgi:hypothetical protein
MATGNLVCCPIRIKLGYIPNWPNSGISRNVGGFAPHLSGVSPGPPGPPGIPKYNISRTFQTKDPKSKHCFSTPRIRNRIPDFPDVRSQIEAVLFHTKGSKPIPGLSKLGIPDRNTAFPHQGSQTESRAFSDRSPAFPQCRGANLSPSRGSVIGVHITVTASCSLIFKSHEAHHVGSVGCEHGSPTPTAWSGVESTRGLH